MRKQDGTQKLKIKQQTEQRKKNFPCAERPVFRSHGEQKGEHGGAEAEQKIPESVSEATADRAEQVIQQTEPHTQSAGKQQGDGLRADAQLHSAEQPRPEAALGRRFLIAQLAQLAPHLQLPDAEINPVDVQFLPADRQRPQ